MTSTTPSAWPEHLCVVAPPAGVEPAITFDEAAAAASLANVSALEAACAQISAVVGSGGVALVFNCAAPLCCAYLVASGRATLAESISLVAARLGAHAAPATPTLLQLSPPPQQRFRWLGREALQALLRLEMRVRGEASDLSTVPGFPLHWLWVHMTDGGDRTTLVARGRVIEVLRLRPDPRMALVRGFLSSAEARHIVELARASLHPSRVVNHEAGGTAVVSDARTSYSCKVGSSADVVVQRAVQRAAYLSGLSPQHAEAVQLVHYLPGQEYRPHFDWFAHRDARFGEKTAVTGNRLVSFFVYLSGCEAGGHTGFPRLGQSFAPEEGTGVVWYNLDRNGAPDERTLHAGCPVERGEKWGLNIWLRERPFRPAPVSARVALDVRSTALGAARVHVQLQIRAPAAPTRCPACDDEATPLGLCLCRANYSAVPPPPPPDRIDIYCDGKAVYQRTTLFSREPAA